MGHPSYVGVVNLQWRDSVLHANPQLTIGFVDGPDGINPMSLEIMIRALQVKFGLLQGVQRVLDLGMPSERWGRLRNRNQHGHYSERAQQSSFHCLSP
jgi:hypothetical protein